MQHPQGITPLPQTAFTILWTSDPQWYAFRYQDIYRHQIDWTLHHYQRLGIGYIAHTGDLLDLPHNDEQWAFVTEVYKPWDDADVPYGLCAGNHDVDGRDYTEFQEHFGAHRFAHHPWYRECYDNNRGHADVMTLGGIDWLFLYLGHGTPTEEDIAWLCEVLEKYPDHIAVLGVHEYLYASGERTPTGQTLFERVVVPHKNVQLVLCGHFYNAHRLVDKLDDDGDGVAERTVYQLIANYQNIENGGNGFMRFLECDPAEGVIRVRTYSPYIDAFCAFENREDERDDYGYRDEFTIPFDFRK